MARRRVTCGVAAGEAASASKSAVSESPFLSDELDLSRLSARPAEALQVATRACFVSTVELECPSWRPGASDPTCEAPSQIFGGLVDGSRDLPLSTSYFK